MLARDLDRSLVLFDPDNGLIVSSATGDRRCKYASYEDVARVYEACAQQSVIAVFQHFARRKWPDDLVRLGEDLRRRSGLEHLSCIAPDGLVAYFLASKSADQGARVWEALERYNERHSCRHLLRL